MDQLLLVASGSLPCLSHVLHDFQGPSGLLVVQSFHLLSFSAEDQCPAVPLKQKANRLGQLWVPVLGPLQDCSLGQSL